MALFGFGKKKEEVKTACACKGQCSGSEGKNTRFLVLGACCKTSADSFANVRQAVAELGLPDQVLNIGDSVEIARYGVMQTPALVIDNKVVCSGRLIKVEDAKRMIEKAGKVQD